MEDSNIVYKALVSLCNDVPCATIGEVVTETRLTHARVSAALTALERQRRAVIIRDHVTWANPLNERSEPLVCGSWCSQ